MDKFIDIIKVVVLAIIEGISEWLPISSSGHMLLVDKFINLKMSSLFKEVFFIVVQLGAILSVVVLFYKRIIPFYLDENKKIKSNKSVLKLWKKIIIACIPGGIVAILFDNFIEKYLHTPLVIASMLIVYGIIFLLVEKFKNTSNNTKQISFKIAFLIGLFQVLSIIPGTSRSGATIIGALLLGVSRVEASEFSFLMAIPVMFGMSFIKILKCGFIFTLEEVSLLLIGMIVAFFISLFVIKFLLSYIRKKDFKIFGIYRISLGILILLYYI